LSRWSLPPQFNTLENWQAELPSTLAAWLPEVERVAFCPSPHVGSFISYIFFPPDLVIFFNGLQYLERHGGVPETDVAAVPASANGIRSIDADPSARMDQEPLLEALRALGDQNRLHILELLSAGELYAQEIVGRLGIAQSAVSRHLSLLERAGLVKVRPRGGMKYYAIDQARLDAVSSSLRCYGKRGA
jgi:DNA-binding transcriptional ArsR family regulator